MARRMVRIVPSRSSERLSGRSPVMRGRSTGSAGSRILKGSPSGVARNVSPRATRAAARRSTTCTRMVPGRRRASVASAIHGSARILARAVSRSRAKMFSPTAMPVSAEMALAGRRAAPSTSISATEKRELVTTCWRATHATARDAPATSTTPSPVRSPASQREGARGTRATDCTEEGTSGVEDGGGGIEGRDERVGPASGSRTRRFEGVMTLPAAG